MVLKRGGGCIHVVEVEAAGLGHLQVDHVGGVLEGGHSFLVPHVLQIGVVHLEEALELAPRRGQGLCAKFNSALTGVRVQCREGTDA